MMEPFDENNGFLPPDIIDEDVDKREEKMMTWIGHLSELRTRLLKVAGFFLIALFAVYPFSQKVLNVLMLPLAHAMKAEGGSNRLIFTSLAEGFLTHLSLACFCAVILTFPFFLFQFWQFLKPALYPDERRSVKRVLCVAPLLFACGGVFVFFAVMPAAFAFLLGFQSLTQIDNALPVVLEAKLSEYLSFITHLVLAFGLGFQFPVFLFVLVKTGLCSTDGLKKARRYIIVAVFVFAAVVTPPDVISQIALALPLLGLYEATLLILKNETKNA